VHHRVSAGSLYLYNSIDYRFGAPLRCMAVKIDEATRAIWMVQIGEESTWFFHLARGNNATFVLDYRTSFPHGVKWHHTAYADAEAAVIQKVRSVYELVLLRSRKGTGWELLREGRTLDEFIQELSSKPYIDIEEFRVH
jgi:hypothetical protein